MPREYYKRKITEFEYLPTAEAQARGFIPYAGPYRPVTEEWMIYNAVLDILQNGRDKYCLVKSGSFVEIWIIPSYYRKGYIHGEYDSAEADATETPEESSSETVAEEEIELTPSQQ